MTDTLRARRWLWGILLLALFVRLFFVLTDRHPNMSGGDTPWLLAIGHDMVTGALSVSPATGPAYLVFDGLVQVVVGPDLAPQTIRILNALMGAALCGFVYILGKRYFSVHVGLIAAFALAVNPIFVIEAGNVLTESLFLFLLFGALALYASWQDSPRWSILALVGAILGLATLTRAVSILLPLVLVAHLLYLYGKAALRLVAALLAAYILVVSLWSVYSVVRWNTFVIGAQGLAANFYLGTTNWCGPSCVDQSVGITGDGGDNQTKYVQGAFDTIRADPVGYVRHRIENLLDAELQPYNTVYYPGASIKAQVADWWGHGHSLGDMGRITQADYFWPKLLLYLFHFAALIGGLLGALIGVRQLGGRLPLYGMLAYFLALHTALTAIPRYLLPIEPIWWLFAVAGLAALFARLTVSRTAPVPMRASVQN